MPFVVSIVSVCPMRKEPAHRSEMVSQLLFGEFAEVLEREKDFTRIRCLYDGYEGWCQNSQLEESEQALESERYLLSYTNSVLLGDEESIPVCFGIPIHGSSEDEIRFGQKEIGYTIGEEETWNAATEEYDPGQLRFVAEHFLGTSYLWGGKTVFGVDCSGFVQQVFKFFRIKLLRDAYLQAEQGRPVGSFSDISFGDLAFFQNENGKVTHVGLMLEDNKIIHASGRVRVDELKEDGIYNIETGERSHVLHSIRRLA